MSAAEIDDDEWPPVSVYRMKGTPGICTKCGCVCALCTIWEKSPEPVDGQ